MTGNPVDYVNWKRLEDWGSKSVFCWFVVFSRKQLGGDFEGLISIDLAKSVPTGTFWRPEKAMRMRVRSQRGRQVAWRSS